jgi:ribosomal protein L37AE/L43A
MLDTKKTSETSIVRDYNCTKCKHKTSARIDSERYKLKLCNECEDEASGIVNHNRKKTKKEKE